MAVAGPSLGGREPYSWSLPCSGGHSNNWSTRMQSRARNRQRSTDTRSRGKEERGREKVHGHQYYQVIPGGMPYVIAGEIKVFGEAALARSGQMVTCRFITSGRGPSIHLESHEHGHLSDFFFSQDVLWILRAVVSRDYQKDRVRLSSDWRASSICASFARPVYSVCGVGEGGWNCQMNVTSIFLLSMDQP
ncbi:hypothetical protein BDV11DRAFT_156222 [Aspergillus similis]